MVKQPRLQRHRLSSSTAPPNRDPILGIIVINPDARVDRRDEDPASQNYDAEFGQATAGVVSVVTKSSTQRDPRLGSSSSTRATSLQARNPYSQPDTPNSITGRVLPETKPRPVRSLDRRPDREEQGGSSSVTHQGWRYATARLEAGGPGTRARATSASTGSTSSIPRPEIPRAARSSRAT